MGIPAQAEGQAMRVIRAIFSDSRGATAVEYGLILAMIFLAFIGAVAQFGQTTINMWDHVANEVTNNR